MRVIYIDGDAAERKQFQFAAAQLPQIHSLELFESAEEALLWAESHVADAAFMEIELPGMSGLEAAQKLTLSIPGIRIIFVTASPCYALAAWQADASGYMLKPYETAAISKELDKCVYHPLPSQRVQIQTIPTFLLQWRAGRSVFREKNCGSCWHCWWNEASGVLPRVRVLPVCGRNAPMTAMRSRCFV